MVDLSILVIESLLFEPRPSRLSYHSPLDNIWRPVMSRRKQRSAFDPVYEFDRGRIVAYRDCGLSFREIGSRVGRNQRTCKADM
ncbi:hypothetical protein TNCV_4906801 [Trichonephila clavipes]|uniref:Transposase IS30-like HTH domain-containing protein n=1 Tax=Trichonephila clavipes TaxID=2585209 RepID=A0A8X6RP71_TRICX|nr:hypothetical protein TNCV_4906801 [Trichonephila clavipes]